MAWDLIEPCISSFSFETSILGIILRPGESDVKVLKERHNYLCCTHNNKHQLPPDWMNECVCQWPFHNTVCIFQTRPSVFQQVMEPSGLKKKHKARVTSDPCVCHDSVLCWAVLWKRLMSAIQSWMSVWGRIAPSWVLKVCASLRRAGLVLVEMDYGIVWRCSGDECNTDAVSIV